MGKKVDSNSDSRLKLYVFNLYGSNRSDLRISRLFIQIHVIVNNIIKFIRAWYPVASKLAIKNPRDKIFKVTHNQYSL